MARAGAAGQRAEYTGAVAYLKSVDPWLDRVAMIVE
jgi:hypothetical protein